MLKDDFPFKVEIFSVLAKDGEEITENTPRKRKEIVTTFEENKNNKEVKRDLLIAAREGEIFEIHVHNKTKNAVAMTRQYFGREQDVQTSAQGSSFPVLPVEDK